MLASRAKDRETAHLRRVIAVLGVERWGQRSGELAVVLNKNPDVVSWWVGEGVRMRLEDSEFAATLESLDKRMLEELAEE